MYTRKRLNGWRTLSLILVLATFILYPVARGDTGPGPQTGLRLL